MTVFDTIYRDNLWNGVESRSGPGSGPVATSRVAREIVDLVAELGVTSVLDVGCGDGYWMPDLPGYLGIDPSSEAIALAKARHPDRAYRVGDVRQDVAWSDLIICRDAMQHLPLADGVAILDAARLLGTWLLASTYIGGENVDIAPGEAYSPDLTASPFNLPRPEWRIFDGYHYHETDEVRDSRKHLGLWRLS